ncbi:MAG: PaaI family thioesterase [Planctomycetota bacterium]
MSKRHDPDELKRKLHAFAKEAPFFQLMDLEVLDFGPRWSQCRISPRQQLRNPNGSVHGGVIATLIDAGITQAMLMTDEYQVGVREEKGFLTTVDLRIRYLRPMTAGAMTCESKIVHLGRRIIHASSAIQNDEGQDVALGDAILSLISRST